ncbi:hypothetical protein [Streptomyces sp. NBC_01207]|uniref:hypothetical protein n=1 Tax=Streptomyces sp. NBC_01207 TaxID=2903772 RepID=UPI002E127C1D|nr:hypothetical protein OG457_27215 [Streptomyces sp. NBC_01207]
MTTTATLSPPPLLTPTADPGPVEQALAASIAAQYPPETYLWIEHPQPDGGVIIRHRWTAGGNALGDEVDGVAMAAGLDAIDWLDLTIRHQQVSHRGRIAVKAHPLRPLLADIQAGTRAEDGVRDYLQRALDLAAEQAGRRPRGRAPRWIGVGPALVNRNH